MVASSISRRCCSADIAETLSENISDWCARVRRLPRCERITVAAQPVEYSDNYVTVFPGETVELQGQPWTGVSANWVRVTGNNTPPQLVAIDDAR